MEQMEKMNSNCKSVSALESDPEKFLGFDLVDDILNSLYNKKRLVIMEINKTSGVPIEEDDPLHFPPIVNNNHVKKKSKSSISSPDSSSNSRHVSKRLKKDTLQSETIETSENNQEPSFELTTPTFNLTSTPRTRRSIGRKTNVDISDPIFKLPFEHGWKRELVYRTTSDIGSSRTNRSGDVYYYSPSHRKLRSLREIQEQLDLSLVDNNLTIESFTFLKQPIGINDRSKELIRDANTKLSKEDSFVGSSVKSKKSSKTPVRQSFDSELSDNETKSPHKMKIVFKNVQKKSKSKSKKEKNNSESVNSSIPDYIAEDWNAIQSSVEFKTSPSTIDDVETNTTTKNRRNAEVNGSLIKDSQLSMSYMQSFNYMVKSLRYVFMHLKTQELLSVSRVCSAWNLIAMDRFLWRNVRLRNSLVYDWQKCIETLNSRGTISLDTRRMLIPAKIADYESFWLRFAKDIKKSKYLKTIELYRCPTHVVEDTIYSLPELEILNATSIKNPHLTKDGKNAGEFMTLNLNYLGQMHNLTELRLKGLSGIKLTSLPSFENLVNLKTLSVTSIKSFPKDVCRSLETSTTNLECLELGDCECLSKDFALVLKRLTNLKSLRLENCCGRWDLFAQDIFVAIRRLENLKILELINIDFTSSVEDELEKCNNIKSLLIIPAYVSQSATTNCHLLECLIKMAPSLKHLVWGLTYELLRVTDLFITQYQQNQHSLNYNLDLSHSREVSNNIPVLRTRKPKPQPDEEPVKETDKDKSDNVDIISVPGLEEKLIAAISKNGKAKVIKVPFSGTTRVYLAEQFNDL